MAVGRTTGGKKNFFLVATCFCYLLEVTVSEEKKKFFSTVEESRIVTPQQKELSK